MKKGIASQVFIYIFAVIVIALILFFGFKQIVNIKSLTEKSVYVTFKEDFKDAVNNVYYKNPGSTLVFSIDSRNKPLVLPNGVREICFQGNKVKLDLIKYDDFEVENLIGNECINIVNGRLSFKLENKAQGENTFVEVSSLQ